MSIRIAEVQDVPILMEIRLAVKENVLSNPLRVTPDDCITYITKRGIGWVYEVKGNVVGFTILDAQTNSVWALFIFPEYEKKGIGKALLTHLLRHHFSMSEKSLWLDTGVNTRAEGFYKKFGWEFIGFQTSGEARFEMTFEQYKKCVAKPKKRFI